MKQVSILTGRKSQSLNGKNKEHRTTFGKGTDMLQRF